MPSRIESRLPDDVRRAAGSRTGIGRRVRFFCLAVLLLLGHAALLFHDLEHRFEQVAAAQSAPCGICTLAQSMAPADAPSISNDLAWHVVAYAIRSDAITTASVALGFRSRAPPALTPLS